MKTPTALIMMVWILMISGCAVMTAGYIYAPRDSVWGLGYSEIKMSDDTWRVTFAGYGISDLKTQEFTLLRACEVTQAAGFPFMELANESTSTRAGATVAYALTPQMAVGVPMEYPTATISVRGVKIKTDRAVESAPIAAQIRARYKIR